ncbi:DUF4333 domain-containing protein [Microlunatus antarcticus]|uniref:DUF4333 domain-containing protein n=1 Tax=Microlunatus antarcticus TaxID=53388 RepID=A0A7W5P5T5_9ACTN|nr:hypothetical protein [Microlunatus antarcticus]
MTDHDPRAPWAPHPAPLDPYGPSHAYLPPAYTPSPTGVPQPGPAPDGRRLAITGVVLGGLALLGVLLLGVYALTSTFVGSDDGDGSGGSTPIRGTIAPSAGAGLDGPALAAEIARQVRDEGGDPENVTCPATAQVAQDVTTVCHGDVDGDEYAFVVFFEDAKGDYTLLPI